MFPVISLGPFSISSYGIFLSTGFLFGVFLVWRLARAWDLNEEKILDLTILTFLGGLIGARVYFILDNFPLFGTELSKWILFHKYQGFSFWGALLGGFIALKYFAKKFKLNFWQALDFASVGLLGGLIFYTLGCFFGGCNIGGVSKLFFAVPMVGALGKRIPVQVLESVLILFILARIWKVATHFHIQGIIAAISLICIGTLKLVLSPLKENHSDVLLDIILIILGTTLFYKVTKRSLRADIKTFGIFLKNLIIDSNVRSKFILRFKKNWYNYMIGIRWKIRSFSKILRRLNVRFSHKDSKYY